MSVVSSSFASRSSGSSSIPRPAASWLTAALMASSGTVASDLSE